MIDNTKVGKAIVELRQKQNLTQKQLADKFDEKFGFISDATQDVREKAAEVGGEAVNKAMDLVGGLFKKVKK